VKTRALLSGLAFAILAATPAAAQEPEPVAPAEEPAAAPEAEPEPEAAAQPAPPPRSGIEEIIVRGAESDATRDFEAGDSVTGFGAEDLAALGAQSIADLAEFTPNLEIVTSGATTPTFFIRGVGLNDFNANSTGAVAIYQDDIAINAPALQLGSLYDVEQVNILRGPQGTGLARNASAGAIKIYNRKPSGEFGGFLRSELGNFNFRDFEGAVEAPVYEDLMAGRFAFRLSERDGTMKNRCGNELPANVVPWVPGGPAPIPIPTGDGRIPVPPSGFAGGNGLAPRGLKVTDPPWSICGEPVVFSGTAAQPATWSGISNAEPNPSGAYRNLVPVGLEPWVNNIDNWAARGTLLFQPTLDTSFHLSAHGAKRDELSRLGQSHGTNGVQTYPDGSTINGLLGGPQGNPAGLYVPYEVRQRMIELAPCLTPRPGFPDGDCTAPADAAVRDAAQIQVANEIADDLDSEPWEGDFNRTGPTTNDSYGGYLKSEFALPAGLQLTTSTGYDHYDRLLDIDLDFSPETLFEIVTDDKGWQVYQDVRLESQFGDERPVRWDIGAWFLREQLDVIVTNNLGNLSLFGVGKRDYTQDVWSAAGYLTLGFDFWERFTLDGGFRYNWEQKKLDYLLFAFDANGVLQEYPADLEDVWSAPTGTVRLTYRFREDTHAFWKYTRGWKPGTYNATSNLLPDYFGANPSDVKVNISTADPEVINAFETGVRGSWLDGRLNVDFSLFYYDYQDYQLFTSQQFDPGTPEFVILNAEGAEVYGAEIDAVVRPWLGAFLNARIGWLESEFLDFVQLQQERLSGNRVVNREIQNTGNRLLNSPQFKVSLTGEQTIPLGRWGALTARYDGTWTDATYYDATAGRGIPNQQSIQYLPENTIGQRPYWLHNLRLSYRLPGGSAEIAAWVRNLTDLPYKTYAFDASSFRRTTIYFVGDPRTFGGSLIVNF
jgi:outer membrane receptor protein involved in Fe transport